MWVAVKYFRPPKLWAKGDNKCDKEQPFHSNPFLFDRVDDAHYKEGRRFLAGLGEPFEKSVMQLSPIRSLDIRSSRARICWCSSWIWQQLESFVGLPKLGFVYKSTNPRPLPLQLQNSSTLRSSSTQLQPEVPKTSGYNGNNYLLERPTLPGSPRLVH